MAEEAWSSTRTYVPILSMSSLVRATNVFCGLEKQNSSALDIISLWSVTTFDICCFRGVTALAITTHVKALGFCYYY
jgi:hypothetical protein